MKSLAYANGICKKYKDRISKNLNEFRKNRKLPYSSILNKFGGYLSEASLKRYFSGSNENIPAWFICAFCENYKISADKILGINLDQASNGTSVETILFNLHLILKQLHFEIVYDENSVVLKSYNNDISNYIYYCQKNRVQNLLDIAEYVKNQKLILKNNRVVTFDEYYEEQYISLKFNEYEEVMDEVYEDFNEKCYEMGWQELSDMFRFEWRGLTEEKRESYIQQFDRKDEQK